MKAEDLRIGNWVTWEGEACKLDGITREFNDSPYDVEIEFSNGLFNREPIEDLKPIPLSEEWLLNKFKGFILYGWDDMKLIRFKDETSDFTTTFELEIIDGKYYYEGGLVEFVHDLQNCYYYHANQKKELTIEK